MSALPTSHSRIGQVCRLYVLLVHYAVLVHPSANRVYAQSAPALLVAELRALDALALGGRLADVAIEELGGVAYVTFTGELDDDALAVVSNASSLLALFERDGDTLRPLTPARLGRWDDDLVSIPRYSGKTNEQLTHLLVNLAIAASGAGASARVLDPLCGRGTTLHVATLLGHDAAGIDTDKRDVDEYVHFFTRWLKDKRAKHSSRRSGARTTITFAPDKETPRQEVVVIADDTTKVVTHLGKSSVDAIATDLPYSVQHRGHPRELLDRALPVWRSVLRGKGGLALSWNTKVVARAEVVALLDEHRFTVVSEDAFAHRVDQAIDRDVVVATRS
jgi:SAM-dependent methyltransferase